MFALLSIDHRNVEFIEIHTCTGRTALARRRRRRIPARSVAPQPRFRDNASVTRVYPTWIARLGPLRAGRMMDVVLHASYERYFNIC